VHLPADTVGTAGSPPAWRAIPRTVLGGRRGADADRAG